MEPDAYYYPPDNSIDNFLRQSGNLAGFAQVLHAIFKADHQTSLKKLGEELESYAAKIKKLKNKVGITPAGKLNELQTSISEISRKVETLKANHESPDASVEALQYVVELLKKLNSQNGVN